MIRRSLGFAMAAAFVAVAALSVTAPLLADDDDDDYGGGGSSLTPYLVGFYDAGGQMDSEEAEVFLVNPTPWALEALVVIFDTEQNPVNCGRFLLEPNDFDDFDIESLDTSDEGAIKVVSVRPGTSRPRSGLVGWVRHEIDPDSGAEGKGLSDTQLASLPGSLLRAKRNRELRLIVDYVEGNCPDLIDEEGES